MSACFALAAAENLYPHARDARAEPERGRGPRGEIDDSSEDVRTSIVHAYPQRLAIVEVGNPDLRAQRQRAVRGGQSAAVVAFAAGRPLAVEVLTVDTRTST